MSNSFGIYTESVDCIAYSIAYSISLSDRNIILITDTENSHEQHLMYSNKILDLPNTKSTNFRNNPVKLDDLCVDLTMSKSREYILKWCNYASNHTTICGYGEDNYWHTFFCSNKANT